MLICCISLPPATITFIPIYDFAVANKDLANKTMIQYYSCCGKGGGCVHSFHKSGNIDKCPFCNSDRGSKTDKEDVEDLMKRVNVNDAGAIFILANSYHHGREGLQQDPARAIELYVRAAELGYRKAHYHLGNEYCQGGDSKKAKFHYEAAAMAGDEVARYHIGFMEYNSGNMDRAVKHWTIAASTGDCYAMDTLRTLFETGRFSRNAMDSTLTVYNNACVEMRSEARDAYIRSKSN